MAMRGSPARRIVGNPLGGVLGHLDQRARIAGRRQTGQPGEQDPLPTDVIVGAPAGPAAAVLATGEDGRAQWVFPAPYAAPPVVQATAVDPCPDDDDRTVLVALEEVTAWCAVVRVWRTRARRGTGVAEPVGAGVRVHVMAMNAGSG
ncbi:hypothetical protein [Streptomyces carpinensis]|uniref:Uncharacterized protein n=1 Tax=Streptomyces carpinensis TaxID=66369 RepID=A0ABV1W552_9ACTN|nr:hypothetical protein [Streptomyces carpinensis]